MPGVVIVGYREAAARTAVASPASAAHVRVLHVAPDRVAATVAQLRRRPGVAYAAPDPIAHATEMPATETPTVPELPNDPGLPALGGLLPTQWNFFGPWGVNATAAWANAAAAGHPGAAGVRIAVLDTGVAYRNWGRYRKSPDFAGTRIVAPYDFILANRFPLDRVGHGTHVAGTIAETTGNGIGVSGLAWRAQIIPVRVLDASGNGDVLTITRGLRYAIRHGAQIINLSLEFPPELTRAEIPSMLDALREARARGVLVVASTGNEGLARIAYPARASEVLAVGATTDDGCLATFSNDGVGMGVVAPGGGDDANLPRDPNCHRGHIGTDIYQMTFAKAPNRFGLPAGMDGTSMAAPHVTGTAALIIASRVLGPRPTPAQLICRIKLTARPLGLPSPNRVYGYGLLDAGAATSPTVNTPRCTGLGQHNPFVAAQRGQAPARILG